MPQIKHVGHKIRYSVERLDGGYNSKESPSRIGPYDSPDCLNVVFDKRGAVSTRLGSAQWNTTAIGTFAIDGGISYNQTMIVFANGNMYRASGPSGTTFTLVTQSSGKFAAGTPVAAVVYQNVLFCSDGTNGPWKYTGSENFYNMGIDIPSAPTGASLVTVGPLIQPGTYYYAISYLNTQVVEGQMGSASAGVILTATSAVGLTAVPTGSTSLAGISNRFVYRADAASGPFRKVGTIADNTTTTFTDNTIVGGEGKSPVLDGTKPTVFNTIALHNERLFFDDASNKTLLRWTDFTIPYISEAENFEPINNGDGENILAIASQDNFLTVFKVNKSVSIHTLDPSDASTWLKKDLPANLGIVSPRAFARIPNGILFVGRRNNRITGVHFLTGEQVVESADGKLRSLTISDKIEYDILNNINPASLSTIACTTYNNRFYMAYPSVAATSNDLMFWLDLNRVGTEGQPGSWSPWSGIPTSHFFTHNGLLFAVDNAATGFVRQLEKAATYSDSGTAINSYFWTKEVGGDEEQSLDAYVKDFRRLFIWHEKLGNYFMNIRLRIDGDSGVGQVYELSLNTGAGNWGSMVWGVDPWGALRTDLQSRIPLGRLLGRRIQVRFDNQNTVNQAFKVHRVELDMNIRRP